MSTGARGLPFTRSLVPVISLARGWRHAQQAIEAARRGQGIALVNTFLVGDDLASGSLVRLFQPGASPWVELGAYVFAARADRWQSRAIADFRRWLRAEMGQTEQPSRVP